MQTRFLKAPPFSVRHQRFQNIERLKNIGSDERGVVLMVALIVLVAMTLAGVALMRSTSVTNLIAGNLAFHQAATSAGEIGADAALTFLANGKKAPSDPLYKCEAAKGCWETIGTPPTSGAPNDPTKDPEIPRDGKTVSEQWDAFFSANGRMLEANPLYAGNTIRYAIHRLCVPTNVIAEPNNCVLPPSADGNSKRTDHPLLVDNLKYYRITVRIEGPRNTVSYLQTLALL